MHYPAPKGFRFVSYLKNVHFKSSIRCLSRNSGGITMKKDSRKITLCYLNSGNCYEKIGMNSREPTEQNEP